MHDIYYCYSAITLLYANNLTYFLVTVTTAGKNMES